jgi:hypothetical protein
MSSWNFALFAAVKTAVFVGFIAYVIYQAFQFHDGNFTTLATLILVGLAAFIGIMNILSFSSHWMGIVNPNEPFGLPAGTVRAILTISFIVLVGVLASFLLTQSSGRMQFADRPIVFRGVSQTEAQAMMQRYAAEGIVFSRPAEDQRVDVHFLPRLDHRLADDVAKQILTILSTILAALIGFYFGAKTDTPSVKPPTEPTP